MNEPTTGIKHPRLQAGSVVEELGAFVLNLARTPGVANTVRYSLS